MYRFLARCAVCCPLLLLLLPMLLARSQPAFAQQDNSVCVQDPGTDVFAWSGTINGYTGDYFPTSDPKEFDHCLKFAPSASTYVGRTGEAFGSPAFRFFLSGQVGVPQLCYSYSGFTDDASIGAFPQQAGTVTSVDINVNNFDERRVTSVIYLTETSSGVMIRNDFSSFDPPWDITSEPVALPTEARLATALNRSFIVTSADSISSVLGIVTDLTPRATSPCAPPPATDTPTPTLTPTPTSTLTPIATSTSTLTPTSTTSPTPTSTLAPISTSIPIPGGTVAPSPCSPRPHVQVRSAADGPGRLRVTVTAHNLADQSANQIRSIVFGGSGNRPMENAMVDIGALTGRSGAFTYTPPAGTSQVEFLVRRLSGPGAVSFVPFEVHDACADAPWRTFVGMGVSTP